MFFPTDDFLELNKFREVNLPTTREIFSRTGSIAKMPSQMFSGDEYIPGMQSKTDAIAAADAEYREFLKQERDVSES